MTQEEINQLAKIMKAAQIPQEPGPPPVAQQAPAAAPAPAAQARPSPSAPGTLPLSPIAAMQRQMVADKAANPGQYYTGAHARGGAYAAQGVSGIPMEEGGEGLYLADVPEANGPVRLASKLNRAADQAIQSITPTYDPNASTLGYLGKLGASLPASGLRLAKGLLEAPVSGGIAARQALGEVAEGRLPTGSQMFQVAAPFAMAAAGPLGGRLTQMLGAVPALARMAPALGKATTWGMMGAPALPALEKIAGETADQESLDPLKKALVEQGDLFAAPFAGEIVGGMRRAGGAIRGRLPSVGDLAGKFRGGGPPVTVNDVSIGDQVMRNAQELQRSRRGGRPRTLAEQLLEENSINGDPLPPAPVEAPPPELPLALQERQLPQDQRPGGMDVFDLAFRHQQLQPAIQRLTRGPAEEGLGRQRQDVAPGRQVGETVQPGSQFGPSEAPSLNRGGAGATAPPLSQGESARWGLDVSVKDVPSLNRGEIPVTAGEAGGIEWVDPEAPASARGVSQKNQVPISEALGGSPPEPVGMPLSAPAAGAAAAPTWTIKVLGPKRVVAEDGQGLSVEFASVQDAGKFAMERNGSWEKKSPAAEMEQDLVDLQKVLDEEVERELGGFEDPSLARSAKRSQAASSSRATSRKPR